MKMRVDLHGEMHEPSRYGVMLRELARPECPAGVNGKALTPLPSQGLIGALTLKALVANGVTVVDELGPLQEKSAGSGPGPVAAPQ
jgi:hypothetical protein